MILALTVPLLAGCAPYATPPDKSSLPWRTPEPAPVATSDVPLFAPALPQPNPPDPDFPMLPSPPAAGPLVIDTSALPQRVVFKIDRMTKRSWSGHIRNMAKGQAAYTVQCRGKGQITVELDDSAGSGSRFAGECGAPKEVGAFGAGIEVPPDGATNVTITAPRGAQWALLVTQPRGS